MSDDFTFEAKYEPGQRVRLLALQLSGTVTMVRVDEGGMVDYLVVWWSEGKRSSEWLNGREIEDGP